MLAYSKRIITDVNDIGLIVDNQWRLKQKAGAALVDEGLLHFSYLRLSVRGLLQTPEAF